MIQHIKDWWAVHVTWFAALVAVLSPSVLQLVTTYPKTSVLVGGLWSIIMKLTASPVAASAK
jgi:hypothetical protein